jgi:hypothetical protein
VVTSRPDFSIRLAERIVFEARRPDTWIPRLHRPVLEIPGIDALANQNMPIISGKMSRVFLTTFSESSALD